MILSCGGGGGGPTDEATSKSFSGVAIDGALYRATAFLDLNGNGQLDSGEPSTTTDASGTYTLNATQQQAHGLAMRLVQTSHCVGAQAERVILRQPLAGLAKSVCIGGGMCEMRLVKHTERTWLSIPNTCGDNI